VFVLLLYAAVVASKGETIGAQASAAAEGGKSSLLDYHQDEGAVG